MKRIGLKSAAVRLRLLVLLAVAGALLGCNRADVAQDLTQAQATEIVAALNESGIPAFAERQSGGRGNYTVSVKSQLYGDAIQLLHKRGLPSEARPSFRELIASRGLVPDSREVESLRLDRALAAELEEALEIDPNVASARVIVRLNSLPIEMSGDSSQAGVSASIRVRSVARAKEQEIRDTISRAIPGIDPVKIHLAIHADSVPRMEAGAEGVERAETGEVAKVPLTEFLWIWRVPESDYNSLAAGLFVGILVVLGLGAFLGSALSNYRHARFNAADQGAVNPSRRLGMAVRENRARRELPDSTGSGPQSS